MNSTKKPVSPSSVLRTMMAGHNITQQGLADGMKMSRITVSQLVNGHRNITPQTAILLARIFDTTPEYWLGMQQALDLFEAKRTVSLKGVPRLIPTSYKDYP